MKAHSVRISSGAACGTYVTIVESDEGELLGFIRVVNIDWTPALGMSTYFAVHQCNDKLGYGAAMFGTLMEAYNYLGISIEELDASELPEHSYTERRNIL